MTINVVLDTNVIISAALSASGNPAKVVDLILSREDMRLYYASEIFTEYKEVLARPRLNIAVETRRAILKGVKTVGVSISPTISEAPFSDESDRIFYDAAKSAGAFLVTGNMKHYPNEEFILTPAEFLSTFL